MFLGSGALLSAAGGLMSAAEGLLATGSPSLQVLGAIWISGGGPSGRHHLFLELLGVDPAAPWGHLDKWWRST